MMTERCPPPDWADQDDETDAPLSFAEGVERVVDIARFEEGEAARTPRETEELKRLLQELKLPSWDALSARVAAHGSHAANGHTGELRLFLHRLAIVSQRLSVAHAQGEFSESERAKIRTMARALEVEDAHVDALEEYYRTSRAPRVRPVRAR